MNFYARCLCGPPRTSTRVFAKDAKTRVKSQGSDPTGTLSLQGRFRRELNARWDRLRKLVPAFVTQRTDLATTINHEAITGQDPVMAFQRWLDQALKTVVVGDGRWMARYVREAGDVALQRTATASAVPNDRIPLLQSLATTELQGIAEAASQRGVRAYADGLMLRKKPHQIARDVRAALDAVGARRSALLVSFIVVRAYAATTLDALRALGVTHVGTIPERTAKTPSTVRGAMDAKKSKKASSHPDLVEVLTAGDDDVCQICEQISEDGPYTIDEADGLIPAHPICRCAFVPWDDARFASVRDAIITDHIVRLKSGRYRLLSHTGRNLGTFATREEAAKHEGEVEWFKAHDAFDPDEPRNDDGTWSGLGGAAFHSWTDRPRHDSDWSGVEGQDHSIHEPPLPSLKQKSYSYQYTDKVSGEKKTHTIQPPDRRLASGVIMREPDGRVWLVKPTNGHGGYDWTFPKGGVDRGLHPQANAIKEVYEETGLRAKITGYAGDYHGDTSVTRMYHAVRAGGHPKDKGWETEQVALAHPDDLDSMLNRSRDRKIAKHHVVGDSIEVRDDFDPSEPRDEKGQWTSGGGTVAQQFKSQLQSHGIPISKHNDYPDKDVIVIDHPYEPQAEIHAAEYPEITATKIPGATMYEMPKWQAMPKIAEPPGYIDMQDLTKVSGKKGTNEGGVYKSPFGDQYYVKKPVTSDHVQNELLTARLYQLAGVRTMNYVPVKGGEHVATELQALDKDNVNKFNADERHEAQKDFAVHAWLANWDAAGTGGDNQVIVGGKVHTVDTGGGLKYRAQGEAKGAAFGSEVIEFKSLRGLDPNVHALDAAALYGNMTKEQIAESVKRVKAIPDGDIVKTVIQSGGSMSLANQLIARKDDLVSQVQALSAPAPKTILGPNTSVTPSVPVAAATRPVGSPHKTATGYKKFEETGVNTKNEYIKHMLVHGATGKQMKEAVNWPSMDVPGTADKLGLTLTKTKIGGGQFHYKGTPKVAGDYVIAPSKPARSAFDPEPHTSKSFYSDLKAAGVHNSEGIKNHPNGTHLLLSMPTTQAAQMAEVAKSHPEWKLQEGMKSTYLAPKSAFEDTKHLVPAVIPAKHDISTPVGNFKASLEEHGVEYYQGTGNSHSDYIDVDPKHAAKAQEIAKWHPAVTTLSPETYEIAKSGKAPAPIVHPPATPDELKKAQKNTKLTAQYVPGAPAGHPEAEKLIAAFNAKYEGQDLHPSMLQKKVSDFKLLTAQMVPLQNAQQKAQVELATKSQTEQKAAHAKALAEQAAKKLAEKTAFEASLTDPKIKAQYDALHSIGISNAPALDKEYGKYIKEVGATGHKITGADAAYIIAYRGSAYDSLNENLWKGDKINLKQSIYASALQKALDKMPSYEGYAQRGVQTAGAFERYAENVGHVVTEKGFSSYGAKQKLWGKTTIHLRAKDLKDIRTFNPGEGGGELILQRGALIHITKVDHKTKEVWAEQIA